MWWHFSNISLKVAVASVVNTVLPRVSCICFLSINSFMCLARGTMHLKAFGMLSPAYQPPIQQYAGLTAYILLNNCSWLYIAQTRHTYLAIIALVHARRVNNHRNTCSHYTSSLLKRVHLSSHISVVVSLHKSDKNVVVC